MTKIKKLVVEMYIIINQIVRMTISGILLSSYSKEALHEKIESLWKIINQIRDITLYDIAGSIDDLEKIIGEKSDVDAIAENSLPELPYEIIRNLIDTFPLILHLGSDFNQRLYPVISISEEEDGTCWMAKYEYETNKKGNFRLVIIADSSRKLVKEIRDASKKEYRL